VESLRKNRSILKQSEKRPTQGAHLKVTQRCGFTNSTHWFQILKSFFSFKLRLQCTIILQ